MQILLLFALLTVSLADEFNQHGALPVHAARNGYSPYFEPPTNIAAGRPLSHIREQYRQYACTVDRRDYYEHGELFRISYETRCVTYRCEFGSYYIYQEGCLDISTQKCVYVGHSWTVRCHNFLCTKTQENNVLRYAGVRNHIGCYDQQANTCRRENEAFPYQDENGVIRNSCTCKIVPGATQIVCFGNNQRVTYVVGLN